MPMIAMMEDTISLAGSFVSDDVASYVDVDVDVEMDDHDAIATATTSTMSAHPNRVSMEEYYSNVMQHARNILPIEPTDAPPSYDLSMAPSSLRRTFSSPVQPREDEGNEQLPEYSSAISLECIFSRKMELEGPIKKAHDRNWSRIFVTLQGTALSFYTFKAAGMLAKHQLGQKTPDLPAGTKKGFKFKTYNLQHADVGIAADYLKRPYVIRVRAEADQFLLSCKRIETFVQWLQSLRAAIDLAPPLDERQIPKDHSVPRSGRYRRRPVVQQVENVAQVANDITAATIAEETAASSSSSIVQSRSTVSVDVIPVTSGSSATSSSSSTNNLNSNGALENVGSAQNQASSRSSQSRTANMDQARQARNERFRTAQQRLSSSANPNPSISQPDGKWRPVHKWGPMYDMMYARRCMAILTHKSPRKSNMVIMKGKQWVVDWATGKVERWEPPDYEA